MKIIYIDHTSDIKINAKTSLCLGFFDGFHLGHMALINEAKKSNADISLMTFDISPKSFALKKQEQCLTSLRDKIEILNHLNITNLYILKVSDGLIRLDKDAFIQQILKKIQPKDLYVGSDYSFGYLGKGNVSDLKKYFVVHEMNLLFMDGEKVSSSNIKKLIENNVLNKATVLLNRYYAIKGTVVKGNQIGRSISFPTLNLSLCANYVLPPLGVYAGYTYVHDKKYRCIIDISTHPTIRELSAPLVEAYLLDFNEDIYGEEVKIEFVQYFREAKKFDSLSSLKAQLEFDKNRCKNELQ